MAKITGIVADDMIRCLTLGDRTVVAAVADAHDIPVINLGYRHPFRIAMAVFTQIGGLDMIGVLARRRGAVMAAVAVVRGDRVIEIGRYPSAARMTTRAVIAARDVGIVLALCDSAVVAAIAGALNLVVIDADHGSPIRGTVACLAHVAGLDVICALASGCNTVMAAGTTAGNA